MRQSARTAVLAGLAVLAVALAAATLDSTVVPESGGSGGPAGIGEGDGGLLPVPRSGPSPAEGVEIPFLSELLALLAVLAALAVIAYAFVHWRRTLASLLAAAVLLVLTYVLSQLVTVPTLPAPAPMPEPGNGSVFGGGGGDGESGTPRPTPPSLALLVVLGLALVGAVVALLRSTGEDGSGGEAAAEPSDGGPDIAAVGRAAGRAADRLEAETASGNEVYRTWREMTEFLDVEDPRSSTPGEFAAAAVDAGLGREDVAELTRLFEDVRYGETRPAEEHEERAIAVFRRIEGRYADDDASGSRGGDDR